MNSPVAKDGKHRQKKKGDICPVCVDPIVDSGKGKKGQDAVFCDGHVTHGCTVSVQDCLRQHYLLC